jgi:tetratricopeptide (TPR) repeat protein
MPDRDNPEHMRQLAEQGIEPIDMVVVNLYPFEKTIAQPDCTFEQAIEMYNEAIGRSKDNASAYTNLGNAYYKVDRIEDAVEAWKRAIEIDPGNPRDRSRQPVRAHGPRLPALRPQGIPRVHEKDPKVRAEQLGEAKRFIELAHNLGGAVRSRLW